MLPTRMFAHCLLILTVAANKVAAQPVEWPVAAGGNGHFYEAVASTQMITWDQANLEAESRGGHLVTITSHAENDFVFTLVDDNQFWVMSISWRGPWIGAIQLPGSVEPDDGWTWVTGEPFEYTNWNDGQPNEFNGNNEDRIHFGNELGRVPSWNDVPAGFGEINSYVIEYVPEPASCWLFTLTSLILWPYCRLCVRLR